MKKIFFALVTVGIFSLPLSVGIRHVFPRETKQANIPFAIIGLQLSPDHKWLAVNTQPQWPGADGGADSLIRIIPHSDQQKQTLSLSAKKNQDLLQEFPIGWKSKDTLLFARISKRSSDSNWVKVVQVKVPQMNEEIVTSFISAATRTQPQSHADGSIENFKLHPACNELLFIKNIVPADMPIQGELPSAADMIKILQESSQHLYRLDLNSKQVIKLGELPKGYRCSDISNLCSATRNGGSIQVVATSLKTDSDNQAWIFNLVDGKFVQSAISSQSTSANGYFSPNDSLIAFTLPAVNEGAKASGKIQISTTTPPTTQNIWDNLASTQHIEWHSKSQRLLSYPAFASAPNVTVIDVAQNAKPRKIKLPVSDDLICSWGEDNDKILFTKSNEVWEWNLINGQKRLRFRLTAN